MTHDWDKYAKLIRDPSNTPTELAKIIGCSRDAIYRVRKLWGIENQFGERGPDRAPYPAHEENLRPLEGLSRAYGGDGGEKSYLRGAQ